MFERLSLNGYLKSKGVKVIWRCDADVSDSESDTDYYGSRWESLIGPSLQWTYPCGKFWSHNTHVIICGIRTKDCMLRWKIEVNHSIQRCVSNNGIISNRENYRALVCELLKLESPGRRTMSGNMSTHFLYLIVSEQIFERQISFNTRVCKWANIWHTVSIDFLIISNVAEAICGGGL